ncbi:tubulin polyglutamylase [Acrasis kona]|uniref:Tubulin polyglutamylase n=1 Tax=Acrasis kona TaxID=1008807 RepID=A0AAW2ZEN8_9EUKA
MKFKQVEPRHAQPVKCRYIVQNIPCPFAEECRYDHTIDDPVVFTDDTLTYYLDPRTQEQQPFTVLRRTLEENHFVIRKLSRAQLAKIHTTLHWTTCYPNYPISTKSVVNHFPNSHQLTHKNLLSENLSTDFNYLPKSFVFPKQYNEFKNFDENGFLWIMKPNAKGGGENVRVLTREQVLDDYKIQHDTTCSLPANDVKLKKTVVCQYIDKPLLLNNKKVDMRLYVLLKNNCIFLFDDGIVRSASESYSNHLSTLNNPFIHITNNSINNKKMRDNKIGVGDVNNCHGYYGNKSFKLLSSEICFKYDKLYDLVRGAVNKTIFSDKFAHHESKLGHSYAKVKEKCFELLGFDVLFDEDLRPYLLEVNGMPDLDGMSRNGSVVIGVDFDIKAKMLSQCFNIVFCKEGLEHLVQGSWIKLQ